MYFSVKVPDAFIICDFLVNGNIPTFSYLVFLHILMFFCELVCLRVYLWIFHIRQNASPEVLTSTDLLSRRNRVSFCQGYFRPSKSTSRGFSGSAEEKLVPKFLTRTFFLLASMGQIKLKSCLRPVQK